MRTEDHYELAKTLIRDLNISNNHKKAFLLGNIEPDYNRFTYLGRDVRYFSNGHSYRSARRKVHRLLTEPYQDTLLWWFQAGRVFHYLTDSFSRPHNPEFGYRSRIHVAYEWKLHDVAKQAIENHPWKIPKVKGDVRKWVEHRHRQYLGRTKGIEDDIYYIITTVTAAWIWLVEEKISTL